MTPVFLGAVRRDGAPIRAEQLGFDAHQSTSTGASKYIVRGSAAFAYLANSGPAAPDVALFDNTARDCLFVGVGRLDNRRELLAALAGHDPWRDISDSDLLYRAYLRWGKDADNHLRGDWAFASYDYRDRQLVVVRDHFGDTAVYYHIDHKQVTFASDFKSLLALGLPGLKLNDEYIAQALYGVKVQDCSATPVDSFHRLCPGSLLICGPGRSSLETYWSLESIGELRLRRRDDYVEMLRALLVEAVTSRCLGPGGSSGSRVAVSMSGGLDSTAVAAIAALGNPTDHPIDAFTAVPRYPPRPFLRSGDEGPAAATVARSLGLEFYAVDAVETSPIAAMYQAIDTLPDPAIGAFNLHWLLSIMRRASGLGVSILLNGGCGNATISRKGRVSSQSLGTRIRLEGGHTVARASIATALAPVLRHDTVRSLRAGGRPGRLFQDIVVSDAFAGEAPAVAALGAAKRASGTTLSPLQMLQYLGTRRGNLSMLGSVFGLSVLDPTADVRVLEFTVGAPDKIFMDPRSGMHRWLIREAMRGYVPDEVRLSERIYVQGANIIPRLRRCRKEVDAAIAVVAAGRVAPGYVDPQKLVSAWNVVQAKSPDELLERAQRGLMAGLMSGLAIEALHDLMSAAAGIGGIGGHGQKTVPLGRWAGPTGRSQSSSLAPTDVDSNQPAEDPGRLSSGHTRGDGECRHGHAPVVSRFRVARRERIRRANDPGRAYGDRRLLTLRRGLVDAVGIDLLSPMSEVTDLGAGKEVVVVGGGFGGLAAAYFLSWLNFDVTLYEARDDYGGRVSTHSTLLPGRNVEFGAELIGWNHAAWRGLAGAFGLTFAMLADSSAPGPWDLGSPPVLRGEDADGLRDAVDDVARGLAALSTTINPYRPWDALEGDRSPQAGSLGAWDGRSLADWLADQNYPEAAKIGFGIQLGNDNVNPLNEQGMIGVLAQIAGGGCYRFDEDTEVMRCAEGNQALARSLVARSRSVTHQLSTAVTDVTVNTDPQGDYVSATVAFDNHNPWHPARGSKTVDYAVVAVPPTMFGGTEEALTVADLDPAQYAITTGKAVKHFSVMGGRQWKPNGPDGMSTDIGETWTGVDEPVLGLRELSVFSGGDAAQRALDAVARGDTKADAFYAAGLSRLFPDYAPLATAFKAWPNEPYIRCGYSSLGVNQLAIAERLAKPFRRRVIFAGEHTCPAFYGYMEGALESALLATHQILDLEGKYPGSDTIASALDAACAAGSQFGPEPDPPPLQESDE